MSLYKWLLLQKKKKKLINPMSLYKWLLLIELLHTVKKYIFYILKFRLFFNNNI